MCQFCNSEIDQGVKALEALANNEEVQSVAEGPTTEIAPFSLPFPVLIQVSDNGVHALVTNEQGMTAIRGFLATIGHRCDDHD